MATVNIQFFGEVDTENTREQYKASTNINDDTIKLDLHFDLPQAEAGLPETINTFLGKLEQISIQNKSVIREDYNNDGEALDYIRLFLEEIKPWQLKQVLGNMEENKSIPGRLLDLLRLVRVGIYPDAEEGFLAVFDYSIEVNGKLYHQVLAINTDAEGVVDYIAVES